MKIKTIYKRSNSIKKVFIVFSIAIIGLIIGYISKSYAIYKVQKELDIIKSKIGTYTSGDYQVAVLVDGKETDTFPSYEDNYKVESVDCTNGVTATFDIKNWRLSIDDMSSTSCKCTVSFNSKETNSITPIAMSKTELLALNEDITNTTYEIMKTKLLNDTYPVGSIYMSTEDDTVEKVQDKFGGTWVKYSEGTTLVGVNDTYTVNSTGGASSTSVSITPIGSVSTYSGSTGSTAITAAQMPSHNHKLYGRSFNWGSNAGNAYIPVNAVGGATPSGTNYLYTDQNNWNYTQNTGSGQGHTHTMNHSHTFTGTAQNVSIETLSPYTAVYMYKRTA